MEANQQDNRHADRVAAIMERNGFHKTEDRGPHVLGDDRRPTTAET